MTAWRSKWWFFVSNEKYRLKFPVGFDGHSVGWFPPTHTCLTAILLAVSRQHTRVWRTSWSVGFTASIISARRSHVTVMTRWHFCPLPKYFLALVIKHAAIRQTDRQTALQHAVQTQYRCCLIYPYPAFTQRTLFFSLLYLPSPDQVAPWSLAQRVFCRRYWLTRNNFILMCVYLHLANKFLQPGGGEIFRTCPDRPWGPPSLLYNGYRVFPGGRKRPGREAYPSPLLVPRSKNRVALYIYSP
jgi:hypothetical protein